MALLILSVLLVAVGIIGIFTPMNKEKEKNSVGLNKVNNTAAVEYFGAPGPGPQGEDNE